MLVFQHLFPDLPFTVFIIKNTGAIISCTVPEKSNLFAFGKGCFDIEFLSLQFCKCT